MQSSDERARYLFSDGSVSKGPMDAFNCVLDDQKTWLLVDGLTRERPATVHACKTVIVNDLDRKVGLKAFPKLGLS